MMKELTIIQQNDERSNINTTESFLCGYVVSNGLFLAGYHGRRGESCWGL